MSNNLVDFSFVYEMSDNDKAYVHELTGLFLNTVSEGLEKLAGLVNAYEDLDQIRRQAHFLKSSANVIKVKGMFEDFVKLEALAREGEPKDKMMPLLSNLLATFADARPELVAEIEKTRQG